MMDLFENYFEDHKELNLKIKMNEKDIETLVKLVGYDGICIETLVVNFLNDLVYGMESNGFSDRERAKAYYDKAWWSMFSRSMNKDRKNYSFEEYLNETVIEMNSYLNYSLFEGAYDHYTDICNGKPKDSFLKAQLAYKKEEKLREKSKKALKNES